MTKDDFIDICPYDDSVFQEKMTQLVKEPGFEHAVKYVMPNVDYAMFSKQLCEINSQEAFQLNIMCPFLEMLVKKTTAGISSSGFENIDIKILVKDTTLINGVKEQSERYLFTLENSRLFNEK